MLEKDWGLDFPRGELPSALGETRLAHTSLDLSPTRGAHGEGHKWGMPHPNANRRGEALGRGSIGAGHMRWRWGRPRGGGGSRPCRTVEQ